MPMNVGEMLRERERLLALIQEAKEARLRIQQLDRLIVLYSDDPAVITPLRKVRTKGLPQLSECMAEGCKLKPKTRSLCSKHYQQFLTGNHPDLTALVEKREAGAA